VSSLSSLYMDSIRAGLTRQNLSQCPRIAETTSTASCDTAEGRVSTLQNPLECKKENQIYVEAGFFRTNVSCLCYGTGHWSYRIRCRYAMRWCTNGEIACVHNGSTDVPMTRKCTIFIDRHT
jgi:hypothetical protein